LKLFWLVCGYLRDFRQKKRAMPSLEEKHHPQVS
jgi:hypothetical protein